MIAAIIPLATRIARPVRLRYQILSMAGWTLTSRRGWIDRRSWTLMAGSTPLAGRPSRGYRWATASHACRSRDGNRAAERSFPPGTACSQGAHKGEHKGHHQDRSAIMPARIHPTPPRLSHRPLRSIASQGRRLRRRVKKSDSLLFLFWHSNQEPLIWGVDPAFLPRHQRLIR